MTTDNSAKGMDFVEPPVDLIHRIALLTRTLRDSMRELGLDQAIKDAAYAIPDARDRLHYVARMTEQAANRVLNAAEQMQPVQTEMQQQAKSLSQRWQEAAGNVDASLAADTQEFLNLVPGKTQESLDTIMDIIMAQDFQDLTGQVIMKMLGVINAIETELVQVLIDSVPAEKREETKELLNGPQVNTANKSDVVADQDQVDDLLASLGL